MASIAPGEASEGTESGKIAGDGRSSPNPSSIWAERWSVSCFDSPKIMVSANRKSTMPPAIWNDSRLMPSASISSCPNTRKNSRTPMLTAVARKAVVWRWSAPIPAVTAMKTGMVPMGSITTHSVTKRSIKSKVQPFLTR